ncbi:MAG: glucose 1-dehydrogenase [Enhydrobacter sp.]|nr:glucose 1-dehydrogenase [Enhydrobacter sp.]
MARLQGKIGIVTGGGSGIGAATVRRFRREGARVVIADVDFAAAQAVAAEPGGPAVAEVIDVREEAAWQTLVATTERRFGGLHILVNNAGIVGDMASQDPERLSLEEWRRIAAVDTESVFLGCKTAIPAIARSGGGSIVNISSIAALRPTPALAGYGAAKAGVRQLTQSVALHCAQKKLGIRCNSVHPGIVNTPMFEAAFSAEERMRRTEAVPLGRLGEPDDIADAILFLASDEARYITGAKLIVDGGIVMD